MEPFDIRLVAQLAALAPSVHNTQPWRIEHIGHNIRLWAEPARRLRYLDPTGRQLHLSCGAAVEFARLAVRSQGYACTVRLAPMPDEPMLLATLTVGHREPPTLEEERLVAAIPRRYTDRGSYDGHPLPGAVLRRVRDAVAERGCWIRCLDSCDDRVAVLTLLAKAEQTERADSRYVAELTAWRRPNRSLDRMPATALRQTGPGVVTDVPLRDFTGEIPDRAAGCAGGPPRVERDTLVLLGTDADDPVSWLRAGRVLGDLLLTLADAGLTGQPLGPVTDLPVTRLRLQRELGLIGFPQLMLRVGAGQREPTTGRRRVDDVLVATTSA